MCHKAYSLGISRAEGGVAEMLQQQTFVLREGLYMEEVKGSTGTFCLVAQRLPVPCACSRHACTGAACVVVSGRA